MGEFGMGEGERITWETVNGPASGVIVGRHRLGWFVLLDNGKKSIVHPKSIIEDGIQGLAGTR